MWHWPLAYTQMKLSNHTHAHMCTRTKWPPGEVWAGDWPLRPWFPLGGGGGWNENRTTLLHWGFEGPHWSHLTPGAKFCTTYKDTIAVEPSLAPGAHSQAQTPAEVHWEQKDPQRQGVWPFAIHYLVPGKDPIHHHVPRKGQHLANTRCLINEWINEKNMHILDIIMEPWLPQRGWLFSLCPSLLQTPPSPHGDHLSATPDTRGK